MRINLAYPDAEFFSHTQNMPTPWLYWVHPLCKTRTSSSLCVGLYFQLSRENSLPFLPPDSCFCLSLSHACVLPLCLSAPPFPPSRQVASVCYYPGEFARFLLPSTAGIPLLYDSCFAWNFLLPERGETPLPSYSLPYRIRKPEVSLMYKTEGLEATIMAKEKRG